MEHDRTRIEGIVRQFIPNAMTDHSGSGRFASYDATEIQVLLPKTLEGRILTIFHEEPIPEESIFRKPAKKLRFFIDKRNLSADRMIFDGALEDLVETD